MKLLKKSYDGGPDSGVTGYWLIEWKRVFSIVLLHFSPGSREAYHSHAFNALTLWLNGDIEEVTLTSASPIADTISRDWKPGQIKFTPRRKFHKVLAGDQGAWAISIRGPWADSWHEHKNSQTIELTHGRKILDSHASSVVR